MKRSIGSRRPRDWVTAGSWPDGEFDPAAPKALRHAVAFAMALTDALEGQNKKQVAEDAEVTRSTLYDILSGVTWADTATLAKLEDALGRPLWPRESPPPLKYSTT